MGKERRSAECVLYPREGGADRDEVAAGERTMQGWGVFKEWNRVLGHLGTRMVAEAMTAGLCGMRAWGLPCIEEWGVRR